jgi:hypothetical protein
MVDWGASRAGQPRGPLVSLDRTSKWAAQTFRGFPWSSIHIQPASGGVVTAGLPSSTGYQTAGSIPGSATPGRPGAAPGRPPAGAG